MSSCSSGSSEERSLPPIESPRPRIILHSKRKLVKRNTRRDERMAYTALDSRLIIHPHFRSHDYARAHRTGLVYETSGATRPGAMAAIYEFVADILEEETKKQIYIYRIRGSTRVTDDETVITITTNYRVIHQPFAHNNVQLSLLPYNTTPSSNSGPAAARTRCVRKNNDNAFV